MSYWKWWWKRNKINIELELVIINIILFIILILVIGFVLFGGPIGMMIAWFGFVGVLILIYCMYWIYDKLHESYKLYLEETKNP